MKGEKIYLRKGILAIAGIIAAIAILAIAGNGKGATIYVGAGGYNNIQDAIDNASDGDTIIVNASTYTEQLMINKSINLVGGTGAVIKCPSSPEDVYIQESDHYFEYVIAVLGGTYNSTNDTVYGSGTIHVNISGFEINGSNAGTADHYFAGIFIRNAVGNISNNYVHDMYGPSGNGSGEQTFGILAYGNSDLTVYGNTIEDFSRGGIVANGDLVASGDLGALPDPVADIENNVVIGNGLESATDWNAENGIQIGYGATGTVKENEVYDCMCNNPGWASSGIIITGTIEVIVEDNNVHGNDDGITTVGYEDYKNAPCYNITIKNNQVHSNVVGISAEANVNHVRIKNNTIYENDYDGIDIWAYVNMWGKETSYPDNITIQNNKIYNHTYCGIYLSDVYDNISINQNNVHHNGEAVYLDNYYGTDSDADIHYNNIYDNIYYGVWNDGNILVNATLNYWGDATGPYHPTLNSDGLGDNVSDNVEFTPWLDASYPGGQSYTDVFIDTNGNGQYDDGEPAFSSLQDAIDNASDNDTIKVNPGIYRENIVINKPLKIIGDPIIDANGSIGIKIEANDTLIENMTVYNGTTGIYIHNDSFKIHNVTINNCKVYNLQTGIKFDNVEEGKANNIEAYDNSNYGIYLYVSNNITLNNTKVHNNPQQGIFCKKSHYAKITNSSIYNNGNQGVSHYGIYLKYSNHTIIRANIIYDNNKYSVVIGDSNNVTLIENKIYGNNITGVMVSFCRDIVLNYNNIYNNLGYGVDGMDSSNINAQFNYWGDATGPYHATNPSGQGDNVSNNVDVDYSPWLGYPWPTSPMTYHTNDNIEDAINAASDGDTIKVNPGLYKENIVINKPLKIVGDPAIDANGSIGIKIEANNTFIENFTISNCSIGVLVHNASFMIQNVTMDNITVDNSIGAVGNGTIIDNVNKSWINNTRIYNASTFAIKLNSSTNITIENCNWSSNQNGLVIAYSHHNIIQNNEKCIDNGAYGVYLMVSRHNKLLNTDFISGGLYGIYLSNADYNSIENCNLKNNQRGILILGGSTGNIIRNNTLSNSQWDINVTRSPDNIFLNNTVASYPTTFDINSYYGNFTIDGVDTAPADPVGFHNLGNYLNISSTTSGAWMNVLIHYNESRIITSEDNVFICKYNGSWYKDGWNGSRLLNTTANIVGVNITSIDDPIFAPLEEDLTPPTTTKVIGEPNYDDGEHVTTHTPIWLNATDDMSGVNATYYRIWYNNTWHPANETDYYGGNANITNISGTCWYVYRNATVNFNPIYFTEECHHKLQFYSIDNHSNAEAITTQDHYVDDSPPNTQLNIGDPYHGNYVKLVTVMTLHATDGGSCAVGVTRIHYHIWNQFTGWSAIVNKCCISSYDHWISKYNAYIRWGVINKEVNRMMLLNIINIINAPPFKRVVAFLIEINNGGDIASCIIYIVWPIIIMYYIFCRCSIPCYNIMQFFYS